MNETGDIGVFDKSKYYEDSLYMEKRKETIVHTIYLDRQLFEKKIAEGFDTSLLKTVLIGGCYSSDSIAAISEFITQIKPDSETKLIVTDLNEEAFKLIKNHPIEVPKNIKLEMFRSDLTKLGLKSGSIDYIRMDYTQNFIPADKQKILLEELNRVL